MKDIAPEADDKGYYNTTLPVLLIQMIEQNVINFQDFLDNFQLLSDSVNNISMIIVH